MARADSPDYRSHDPRHSALGLLALQQLPGVGAVTALKAALLTTNYDALMEKHGRLWSQALESAQEQLEVHARNDVVVLSLFDDEYPDRFRALDDPPPLLFVHGSVDVLHELRLVAVVGTREPTSFGCSAAEKVTAKVSDAGWGVVSGLAKGVDTIAHGASLKHHGRTIAVMAGGLDSVYPAENRELARAIIDQGGALISEQPWGQKPQRSSFVMRNRLQSALSVAVVIAQTGLEGGTMHTARHAAAQGRPLFAAQPATDLPQNEGLRALLEVSANELCGRIPAWKKSMALCQQLGSEPIAAPITAENLGEFLEALEFALAHLAAESDASEPFSSEGRRAAADDDLHLFAFAE